MTNEKAPDIHGKFSLAPTEVIAGFSLISIAIHLAIRFSPLGSGPSNFPLFAAIAAGGGYLIFQLIRDLVRGDIGSDVLAGISIVAATLLHEYLAAVLVVLMLSGGQSIERAAAGRASAALRALADRMPRVAHRVQGGKIQECELSDLRPDDIVVVDPHEICPADGVVTSGRSRMDEAFLTGEPWELEKIPGSEVLSGSVNKEGRLEIRVTKASAESRYTRILGVMKESEQSRPKIRRLADRLGAIYTPLAIAIGAIAWAVSGDPIRFLSVLVIATPCPLLIGIPVALIGAVSLAAQRGIIIRDPSILENIVNCRSLLVDKTGTLTLGQPSLTDVVVGPGIDRSRVLAFVASLEQHSRHPLARAIVSAAASEKSQLVEVSEISELPGQGVTGKIGAEKIALTSRKKYLAAGLAPEALPASIPGLESVVLFDDKFAALLRFHDTPRPEGKSFIAHLPEQHKFDHIMIVSGDRESEVQYLAQSMGITDIRANVSPEDKVRIVAEESAKTPTIYLGDGINDAPALARATVGIAFGRGSDATSEAAGAVILDPSLVRVDELIHIARHFRKIALQSAVGGMALSVVGMCFGAAGLLSPVAGAIGQEAIDVLAVLGALRASRAPSLLHDFNAQT